MRLKNIFHRDIWVAVLILAVGTIPFVLTNLDLFLQTVLYRSGWFLGNRQPWAFLYHAGTIPGLLLAMGALVVLIGAWIWPRLMDKRRAAALIVLTLLIGPGLLVNALGKEYWGRPRPRDVVEFNGTQTFHRICQPGLPGKGKSFPCGHASVGFLFVALYFVAKRKGPRLSWLGFGLGYGFLMGVGRMTQGAHFASDVLWSGGLTYLSAALLHHVILPLSPSLTASHPGPDRAGQKQKWLAGTLLASLLFLLILFFMLATPYYKTWSGTIPLPQNIDALSLHLNQSKEEVRIIQADHPEAVRVRAELHGFGFPDIDLIGAIHTERTGTTLNARVDLQFNRITTERSGAVYISVNRTLRLSIDGREADGDIRINETVPNARLGKLDIRSRKGGILLAALANTEITGPINCFSQKGDLHIIIQDIVDPGETVWEIGNDKGTVLVRAEQKSAPIQKLKLRGWSRFGDVALTGTISPACGLNLAWNEGDGRSGLSAKGAWQQDGNRVFGPLGMDKPHFEIFLATSNSLIGMELHQGEGEPVTALPTPTARPTSAIHDYQESVETLPPTATPTPEPPAWFNTELLDLSNSDFFKSKSPLGATPVPDLEP